MRDLGTTTDRLGRPARAVGIASPSSQADSQILVLLVSPTTGRLIGNETITLPSQALGLAEPTVTAFQTWLDASLVEGVTEGRNAG